MRMVLAIAVGLLLPYETASAQHTYRLSDLEFLTKWRDFIDQRVTVDRCIIDGTTVEFLRCETRNGAGQIGIDAATMNKDDLRMAYENCPTGTGRRKPKCTVVVSGMVQKGRSTPWLLSASFEK